MEAAYIWCFACHHNHVPSKQTRCNQMSFLFWLVLAFFKLATHNHITTEKWPVKTHALTSYSVLKLQTHTRPPHLNCQNSPITQTQTHEFAITKTHKYYSDHASPTVITFKPESDCDCYRDPDNSPELSAIMLEQIPERQTSVPNLFRSHPNSFRSCNTVLSWVPLEAS